jgi:D-sedoheptulose 7-phosphate isomerase
VEEVEEMEEEALERAALERVRAALGASIRVKYDLLTTSAAAIARAGRLVAQTFDRAGKVVLFGNGGSAADAQHIAAEWVGRYVRERLPLPAVALTSNSSELTAIANDYGFDQVFVRGVAAHGRPGDLALALSTSGNSPNVLAAVEAARERGLATIGLTGKGGGQLAGLVDLAIRVPSDETPRIQESHITICHAICEVVDAELLREEFARGEGGSRA